jgi:hypothetical protein
VSEQKTTDEASKKKNLHFRRIQRVDEWLNGSAVKNLERLPKAVLQVENRT